MLLTIGIAFAFQYGVGPYILDISISNYVTDAWTDGCLEFSTPELQEQCVGNQGVYRATSSALVFFLLAGLAACCKPTANREAWPAKYILFLFLVLATCFIPNAPLFSEIYLNIARIGGVFFVVIQQVIILDLAYNWNESWVEKSNSAETEQDGKRWLAAILVSCAMLFTTTLVGIGLLFWGFGGCASNEAFIAITLILSIVLTLLQLFASDEGSLLSSAVICVYGTYLCYTAVALNPNEACNPHLGQEDVLGIVFGISITFMSLGWTGYSFTAEKTINGETNLEENLVDDEEKATTTAEGDRKVQGVVTNAQDDNDDNEQPSTAADPTTPSSKPVSWKLNFVLGMISCWIAMTLTGWGSIQGGGNAANPDVSDVSMWMLIASQWIVYLLYFWTLMAPKFLPGRDFS